MMMMMMMTNTTTHRMNYYQKVVESSIILWKMHLTIISFPGDNYILAKATNNQFTQHKASYPWIDWNDLICPISRRCYLSRYRRWRAIRTWHRFEIYSSLWRLFLHRDQYFITYAVDLPLKRSTRFQHLFPQSLLVGEEGHPATKTLLQLSLG